MIMIISTKLVLGRTQSVGSEFGIFVGFGWVRSLVLVGEPGFGRVRSSTSRVRSSSKFKVFSKMFIVVGFGVRDIWRVRVGS